MSSRSIFGRCFGGVLGVLFFGAAAAAQERIYVAQSNPAGLEAFSFDGGQIVRQGRIQGALGISGLAVTDKFFALGTDLYSAEGIQLPSLREVGGGRVLIPTLDNRRVLFVGSSGAVPTLYVVDLDPSSATFRRRINSVDLESAGFEAIAGELSRDGTRLYVALNAVALNAATDSHRVVTVDLSNFDAAPPSVLQTETVPLVMTSIHRFAVGGAEYLAVGETGSLRYWPLGANGAPAGEMLTAMSLPGSTLVRDFVIVNEHVDLAYAVVDENTGGPVDSTGREAVYVFRAERNETTGALQLAKTFETELAAPGLTPSGDIDRLFLSRDGAHLFVVDHGRFALTGANVLALARNSAAAPTLLDVEPLDATGFIAQAVAATVAEVPQPVPGAPTIDAISVDGVPGAILINNVAHTLRISGSGMDTVQTIGLRSGSFATWTRESDSAIIVPTSPLMPSAATQPITLITSTGAVARSYLTVANGPTNQPPYLVFADAPAVNRLMVLHAATKTAVTGELATGAGAMDLLVSPDGRLLFAANSRGDSVSAHALTPEAFPGAQFFERREIRIARNPQQMVADWPRRRLFIGTFADKRISVVDVDAGSPTFLTRIDEYLSPGESSNPNQSANIAGFGGLALTADGRYLYAARGGAPWLIVIDTLSSPPDILECGSIPDVELPPSPIRIDGLALADNDNRLLLSASSDPFVRVLDVTPGQCPSGQAGTFTMPGAGSSRRIVVHPDQRVFVVDGRGIRVFAGADGNPVNSAQVGFIPLVGGGGRPALTPDGAFVFAPAAGLISTVDIRTHVNGVVNPSAYATIARTFAASSNTTAAVSPGLLTPAGMNVTIEPLPGVVITFPEVATAGHTTVTAANVSDLPVSSIFRLDRIPVFYEIKTTAEWMAAGPARICLTYNDEGIAPEDEPLLKLLHEENGTTVDRTTSIDVANNVICAEVASFSQLVPVTAKRTPEGMSGAGFIGERDARDHFAFSIRQETDGSTRGSFELLSHSGRGRSMILNRFRATAVSRIVLSDDGAMFSGTGRWNGMGDHAFTVNAVDGGRRGHGDQLTMTITAPDGTVVATVTGPLSEGNLQRH